MSLENLAKILNTNNSKKQETKIEPTKVDPIKQLARKLNLPISTNNPEYKYSEFKGFSENPNINTTENTTVDDLVESDLSNAINSFRQGIDQTQNSIYTRKKDAHQQVIDDNYKKRQELTKKLDSKEINEVDYSNAVNQLDNQDSEASKAIADYEKDLYENNQEIANEPVSKIYKLKQAMVQAKGGDSSLWEDIKYSAPSTFGSSASLLASQFAATFGTGLVKKGATALAESASSGPAAPYVAAAITGATVLGELAYGRHSETLAEEGGQLEQNQQMLFEKWQQENPSVDFESLKPEQQEDIQREIRIQSRKGLDKMYWQQMALMIPDAVEAMLFPGSKVLGALKQVKKIEKAVEGITDVNKITRAATTLGKAYIGGLSEKFEEGYQYATEKRQTDTALNLGEYEDKGTMANILSDSYNTLSSISYGPAGTLRPDGKYSNDKDFQFAEQSGGLMGFLTGGIGAGISISKDLYNYKQTTKELQNSGIANANNKWFKLKDQIYFKHFNNNTLHYLLEGVKTLSAKTDDKGNPYLTKKQAEEEKTNIIKAFDKYNEVNQYVDELPNLGKFNLKKSDKQKAAIVLLKNALFHTSMNMVRQAPNLTHLQTLANLNNLIQHQESIVDKITSKLSDHIVEKTYNIKERYALAKEKLEILNKQKQELLTNLGIEDNKDTNISIEESNKNREALVNELNATETKKQYEELLKVKDNDSLLSWADKTLKKQKEIKKTLEKNADDLRKEFEDFFNQDNEPFTFTEEQNKAEKTDIHADALMQIDELKKKAQRQKELEEVLNNEKELQELENSRVKYRGMLGRLTKHEEEDVYLFTDESTGKIYDIPKGEFENYNSKAYEYGIFEAPRENPITDFIDIEDNKITINGETYINNYSNPLMAINKDEDGNIISVTLSTKNGKPRTFRKYADELAYAILLKTYNDLENESNKTREEIKSRINSETSKQEFERKEQFANEGDSEESKKIEEAIANLEKGIKEAKEQFSKNKNEREIEDWFKEAMKSTTVEQLLAYKGIFTDKKHLDELNNLYKKLLEQKSTDYIGSEDIYEPSFFGTLGRLAEAVFRTVSGTDNSTKETEERYFRFIQSNNLTGHKLLIVTKNNNTKLYTEILEDDKGAKEFEDKNPNYPGIWGVIVDEDSKPVLSDGKKVFTPLMSERHVDKTGIKDKEQAKKDIKTFREQVLKSKDNIYVTIIDVTNGVSVQSINKTLQSSPNPVEGYLTKDIDRDNLLEIPTQSTDNKITVLRNGQSALIGRLYAFDDENKAWALDAKPLSTSQANTIVRLLLELAGIENKTSDNPLEDLKKIVNISLSKINRYSFGIKDNTIYVGEKTYSFEDLKNTDILTSIIDFLEQKYNNANNKYSKNNFQEAFEEPIYNSESKKIEYKKWNTYQDYLLSKFGTYLPELGQPRYRNSYIIFDSNIKTEDTLPTTPIVENIDSVSTELPKTNEENTTNITPKKSRTKRDEGTLLSRTAKIGRNNEKISSSEQAWFEAKFPGISIELVKGLIDSRDFGQFLSSGKVLLSDQATKNTLRHEAWHVVTQLYLTQKEINNLYNEAKERLNNKDLTDKEVEEILAEDFANYKDTGIILANRPLRNTIFRKILNFLKSLIGIKEADIRSIYNRLETGDFTKSKLINNKQFTKLSKALPGRTEAFTKKVLDSIDSDIMTMLFESSKGFTPSKILEIAKLPEDLLNKVYNKFIDSVEVLEDKESLTEKDLDLIRDYDYIIDNWDSEIVPLWKKRMSSLGVELVTEDKQYEDITPIEEDRNEDLDSLNNDEQRTTDKGERSGEAFQEANTVSPKDVMFKQTKMLIRTLNKFNVDGTKLVNDLGRNELVDFNKTYTYLLKNLAGISEYEDQYTKIQELSKSKPEFKQLLERLLAPGDNMSFEQKMFQNQFRQDFDKNLSNSYTTVMYTDGSMVILDNTKESVSGRIKERWLNNLRDPNRNYLSFNNKSRIIVNEKALEEADNIKFLNSIGINFSQEALEVIKDSKVLNDATLAIRNYIKTNKFDLTDLYSSKVKDNSVYSRIEDLLDLDASYTSEVSELSFNSTTGKTVYAISLNNTLSIIKNVINNSKTLEDLFAKLPNLDSVYTKNSYWLKQIFDENGKKRKGVKINLDLLDGLKAPDSLNKAAVQTAKLVEGDKLIQELTNILLKGKSAYLRAADASTEHAISLSTYGQGNHLAITIEEIKAKGFEHRKIKEIFNGYFEDELNSIAEFVLNDLGRNIDKYNKSANRFRVFEGFPGVAAIKTYVLEELESYKGLSKDEQALKVKALYNELIKRIEEEKIYKKFFDEYSNELTNKYDEFGINEDTKLGIDSSLKKYTVKELMDTLAVNDMINSIEQVKLFIGDMAFYSDLFKRTKGISGTKESSRVGYYMNNWLNKNHIRKDGKLADDTINVSIFEDSNQSSNYLDEYINKLVDFGLSKEQAKVLLKAYTEMDEGDAQGWITLDEYKEFFIRNGKWTVKHEKIHSKAQDGETLTPEELFYYMTLKAQYFGPQVIDNLNVPTYHKFSLMPLIPSLVKGTNLEALLDRMTKQQIGYALNKSGSKVGTKVDENGKANKFYTNTISGEVNNSELNIQKVYYRFFGIQLEIEPKVKKEVTFGTQFRKLLFSNLFENGEATNGRFSELLNEYSDIFKTLIETAKKKLLEELHINGETFENTDVQKLVDLIKKEAQDRTLPDNIIDALQKDAITGKLMYKFDTLVNKSKIDSLITSLVNARLIKQMTNGDAYIQGASTGFETKGLRKEGSNFLKFYSSKDGKTTAAECMIPLTGNYKSLLDKYDSVEAVNEALDKGEIDEKLITLIGYRIPTQGLNSIDFFRIKKFLPPESANLIILPTEIVAKSGGDYDIDKMNIFRPHLNPNTETKKLQNRIIEIAKEILEHEDNFIPLITPNSTKILTNVVDELRHINWKNKPKNKDKAKTAEELADQLKKDLKNNIRYTNQLKLNKKVEQFTAFLSGKAGVGIAALQNTHHIISQIANLTLNNTYISEGSEKQVNINFEYNKTKDGLINLAAKKASNGEHNISEVISQVINAVVDIAKDPFIVDINMNLETLSTYLYLVRIGVPFENVAYFMTQPIISDFLKEKAVSSSVFLKATKSNKKQDNIVKELRVKYNVESLSEPKIYSQEELKGFLIRDNQKSEEFNQAQQQFLTDYLAYKEQADLLSEAIKSVNHDTAGLGSNLEAAWNKLQLIQKVEDTKFVNNIDNIYKNTFIGDFNQHKFAIDAFGQFYYTQAKDVIENNNFLAKLINPFGEKKQNKLKTLIINDFINYVVQNYGFDDIKSKLENLFKGENSIAKEILTIKNKEAKTDLDKRLLDNLFIKELFPLIDKPIEGHNAIKIFSKRIDTFTYNSLVESFRELEQLNSSIYDRLAEAGILQSGLNNSPITYFGLIPFEINGDLVNKAFDNFYKKNGVENIYKFNQLFTRNNTKNSVVSGFARTNELDKAPLGLDMYGKTYSLDLYNPELIDFKQQEILPAKNETESKFKDLIKLNKKVVSDLNKAMILSRVKAANGELGTSYYIDFTQVGESDNYTWNIVDKAPKEEQLDLFDTDYIPDSIEDEETQVEEPIKFINNTINDYFKGNKEAKASEILPLLYPRTKTGFFANLIQQILPNLKNDVTIRVMSVKEFDEYGKTIKSPIKASETDGGYNPATNEVIIIDRANVDVNRVILHEVLHAISYNYLKQDNKLSKEFKDLYKKTKSLMTKTERETYPMSNIDEFFAGLSNPDFIKLLASKKSVNSEGLTIWEKLKQILSNVLKELGIKLEGTLLEDYFNLTSNIIEDINDDENTEFPEILPSKTEDKEINVQDSNLKALERNNKTISVREVGKHDYKRGDVLVVKVNNKPTETKVKVTSVTTINDFTKLSDREKNEFAKSIGNFTDFEDFRKSNDYANETSPLSLKYPHIYKFITGQEPGDIIRYSVIEKSIVDQESPYKKIQIFLTRRINRLERELKSVPANSLDYDLKAAQIKIDKEKLANLVGSQDDYDIYLELGKELLDEVDALLLSFEEGQEPTTEQLTYINDILDVWSNFKGLKEQGSDLYDRYRLFVSDYVEDTVNKHSTKKITKAELDADTKDIRTFTMGTGALSDSVNIIARTIGNIIKAAQNFVATKNKKLAASIQTELDLLNEYAKKNGVTLDSIYDLFIQDHKGTTILTKPYLENQDPNPNYEKIQNTPELKRFYDFYQSKITEFEKYVDVPFGKYFIPNIAKNSLKEDIKSLNPIKKRSVGFSFDQENMADILETKYDQILPTNKKERNLGEVLLKFGMYANNYEKMSSILPEVRLLQEQLTYKINSKGQLIERRFVNPSNPKISVSGKDSKIWQQVEGTINMQVKGKMKDENQGKYRIKTTKYDKDGNAMEEQYVDLTGAIDNLLKYNSLLRIGLSPITAISNVLFGDASNLIEAIGGRFFGVKDLTNASNIFIKQNLNKDSDLNRLLVELNPLQELDDYEYQEKVRLTGKTVKMSKEKALEYIYGMQKSGEKWLQSRTMLAVLIHDGYMNSKGELLPKYNDATEEEKTKLTDKIQRLNQQIHGRYTTKEAAIWQQSVVYRMISQFRKWIPAAIESRVGSKRYDSRLQVEIEGRYITIKNLITNLKDSYTRIKEGKLTELEAYNIKKTAAEATMLFSTVLLYSFLKGDDDDKKRRRNPYIKTALTLLNRTAGDLGFFYDPRQFAKLGQSAIPLSKTIEDLMKVAEYLPAAFYLGDYELKTGSSKGYNKFYNKLGRQIPGIKPVKDVIRLASDVELEELK